MNPKYFIMNVAAFILIALGVYIGMFYYQLNSPVKAEWWVHSAYQYKDFKANHIQSKKIIIIAGSNVLFGMNTELIEKKTGYPVINLAVHAALDIDYLYYKIKQHIKKGDIVVMPLELPHYFGRKSSSWFFNNMMAWGNDYLDQLSPIRMAKFIIDAEPSRVLEGVITQIKNRGVNTKMLSSDVVIKNMAAPNKSPNNMVYGYKRMNKDGDINIDAAVKYEKNPSYSRKKPTISTHLIEIYEKINILVKNNDGKLYLTYPVTIRNKHFNLSHQNSQARIDELERQLHKHDIKIYCNAALFNLERKYFFNTKYHPNKYGALIRSNNLGDCIDRLINNRYQRMSYDDAIKKTNSLQLEYQDKVKNVSVTHH